MLPTKTVSMPAAPENFAALGKLLRAVIHREGQEVQIEMRLSGDGKNIELSSNVAVDWDRSIPLISMFDIRDASLDIDDTKAFHAGLALRAMLDEIDVMLPQAAKTPVPDLAVAA